MEHHTRAAAGLREDAAVPGTVGALSPSANSKPSDCNTPTKKQTAAAQLKSLQRTPLPLTLARMKVLLERLNMLVEEGPCSPPAAAAAGQASSLMPYDPTHCSHRSSASPPYAPPSCSGPHSRQGHNSAASEAAAAAATAAGTGPRSSTGGSRKPGGARKPGKLVEVSTSGGLSQSVMSQSADSILDELEVTLGFISDFLAGLPPDTRKALAACARLESHMKDQVIYGIGDEPSHFYILLSGRVDIWTSSSTHRSKSVVSELRRGDAFGDQAIIHGEPHGTAASPATNVTLLVVTRAGFLSVLGSHFRDVAAKWQHDLVTHVAPLAECDPPVVRRLCSMLVSERPPAGQEWSLHDNQVCFFIQAGVFELRLVDMEAKQAAQAALAAAIASSSSALPIVPIPPHLRLGPGGRPTTALHVSGSGSGSGSSNGSNSGSNHGNSSSSKKRRPSSAPTVRQAARSQAAAASTSTVEAAAAAAGSGSGGSSQEAGAGPAAASGAGSGSGGSSQAGAGPDPRNGPLEPAAASGAGSVAVGLELLQGRLAGCPALASVGVLASVRVKDGRLVGTQGLSKQLRQQHSSCVPYKVVGELGPGSWFGGGEVVYGCGPLQSALVVVAVEPGTELVHAPLSGLEKHGGPELLRRLRDDAAFKLTYCLGRMGVLGLGEAVGHPQSTLVAEAAANAAAAAAHAARAAAAAAVAAGQGAQASSSSGFGSLDASCSTACGPSPGRSPCSTFRSGRPASAAAATAAAAAWGGVGGGTGHAAGAAAAASKAAAAAAFGPVLAAKKWAHAKKQAQSKAAAAPLRRTSSSSTSDSQDSQAAATPHTINSPGEGLCHSTGSSSSSQAPSAPPAAAAADPAAAGDAATADGTAVVAGSSVNVTLRASKARPKHVHVPGSGVFSPGVMSALQHVWSLQAAGHAATPSPPAAAAAAAAAAEDVLHQAPHSRPQTTCHAAASSGTINNSSSSSHPQTGPSWGQGCGGRRRASPAAAAGVTSAAAYWQQPDHSSTATGAALSSLLPKLFPDGLEPLVSELDCLLQHAGLGSQDQQQQQQQQQAGMPGQVPQQQLQQQQQQVDVASWRQGPAQLHQHHWQQRQQQQQEYNAQQQSRPTSAAGRLQRPSSAAASVCRQVPRPPTANTQGQQLLQKQQGWGPMPCAADVLSHKPSASLLAASVLWQRSSAAAFRPPVRQCLTAEEIAAQHSSSEGDEAESVL